MSELKAIIGLGNPGERYSKTRHNIGYMVVNMLAAKFRGVWKPGRGKFYYARIRISGEDILLLRSMTFMNESGMGIIDASENMAFLANEMLVVLDDFALPFGALRLRKSGSDGGHNGLASIIYHFATDEIPRLRIGIGPLPDSLDPADFVLSEFSDLEKKNLHKIIAMASDAAVFACIRGLDRAMEIYNRNSKCDFSEQV